MLDTILNYVRQCDNIRAAYLNGSRANPNVSPDEFQDYDIVFVVRSTAPFLQNRAWLDQFGTVAICQEPDSNDCAWGANADYSQSYTWLVLFEDGNRIDLQVHSLEKTKAVYGSDSLTVPLIDKDGILKPLPPASEQDYYVQRPSQEQFRGCCNEFWWCLNNVAKGLAREEMPYTMWMFHCVVTPMLKRMVEWHIGTQHRFQINAGKEGKFFKALLAPELYARYLDIFTTAQPEDFIKGVNAACGLFGYLGPKVAKNLGFCYNEQEEAASLRYWHRVSGQVGTTKR